MNLPNLTVLTLDSPNIIDFAKERNKLLSEVNTDWVLFVDSDEVITKELEKEIKKTIENPRSAYYSAYRLKRQDNFFGKTLKHGETANISFVRLAKRDWGSWVGAVHEKWIGKGLVGTLNYPLLHNPHPSLTSFVDKINKYSTLAASERYQAGARSSLFHVSIYPVAKFIQNYFIRLGILDGIPGLIHAIMMSWHSFLTHAKNYLLWQKN